ncbi:MAG: cytidine deaminase [Ruminococcaceae bacterium]|nr:cytidine deaminase [Oscillospiraceae bacterium]
MEKNTLLTMAKEARSKAYAPYSGFAVGAALLCENGRIYCGCNVESASYSPTVCAERVAFFRAIAEGERRFVAIAIAGAKIGEQPIKPCPPCGVCRQVMREFCDGDFAVLLCNGENGYEEHTLDSLLPLGFSL